jgi:putative alpha-1,2-mannosidase
MILKSMYRNAPDGLCGNDDCGQMSAWYIFSAMGFYPVCPGTTEYAIGAPYLEESTISLPNGKTFTIKAEELSEKNIYVQSMLLNGKPLKRYFLEHEEIMAGGELIFTMGPKHK